MEEFVKNLWGKLAEFATTAGLKLVYAIVILIVGLAIVKAICKKMDKGSAKKNVDPTVATFLRSVVKVLLYAVVIISAALVIGIPAASFIALLGSAGLAIGLALQGSLTNIAGGIMLLVFKPYKVGDYVDVCGISGTVDEINLFYTVVLSIDNKRITVPNGSSSNTVVVDYSSMENRRVDLTFTAAYGSDADLVRKTLVDTANANALVLKDPETVAFMIEQSDSAVKFVLRAWCKSSDYWTVYFALMQSEYEAFAKAGIQIPFPQMDVHVKQ